MVYHLFSSALNMTRPIAPIQENLKTQLTELSNEIRRLEGELLVSKERYLKVQGALEILAIVTGDDTNSVAPEVVEEEV